MADAEGKIDWDVSVDASITRSEQDTGGTVESPESPPLALTEPAGHGIGRSRGGLSSKIHAGVDGHGRPLSVVVIGGRRNDGVMLQTVLDDIHVPCRGPGRARSRPDAVLIEYS
ncbi:transposase [Corynebacterium comes]|uniref:transposase n=1 Tax=Corynebacterium comes TaxID=2675218 RepID=UPI0012E15B8F|nr:transposase [Corynebacterium comes]